MRWLSFKHIKTNLTKDQLKEIIQRNDSQYIYIQIHYNDYSSHIDEKLSIITDVFLTQDGLRFCLEIKELYKYFYSIIDLDCETLLIIPIQDQSIFNTIIQKNYILLKDFLDNGITKEIIVINEDNAGYFIYFIKEKLIKWKIFKGGE